jgi:hypothetical protein
MTTTDFDEPAFPTTEKNGVNYGAPGMRLRDYFMAHADIPWSVAFDSVYAELGKNGTYAQVITRRIEMCACQADAMIAGLSK